jgi:ribose 5-phosphate isomerase B
MLYLGADHNGFALKEQLKRWFDQKQIAYQDCGALTLKKQDDYPDFAIAVGKKIKTGDWGLLICGSGHGMSITANKIKGIRATLATTVFSAKMARHDDHANVLALAAWEVSLPKAKQIITTWLAEKPSTVARHIRRIKKISQLER